MAQKIATRSQRRMERKHAMMLFAVVLVVALASFSLGVMVGRSGQQATVDMPMASKPVQLPQSVTTPAVKPEPSEPAVAGKDEEKLPEEKLTFYDTLPRGGQPLGSGINLPPEQVGGTEEKDASSADPVAKLLPPEKKAPAVESKPVKPAAVARPAVVKPAATSSTGAFVVQIASFQKADQAKVLSGTLSGKGYVTFIKQADLGAKGVWHRVYAGPYSERPLAEKAAQRLRSEEKFSPLVRKQ